MPLGLCAAMTGSTRHYSGRVDTEDVLERAIRGDGDAGCETPRDAVALRSLTGSRAQPGLSAASASAASSKMERHQRVEGAAADDVAVRLAQLASREIANETLRDEQDGMAALPPLIPEG